MHEQVSNTDTLRWRRCDRALYYFKAIDPQTGEEKSIIKMVRYDEVVDGGFEFCRPMHNIKLSRMRYRAKDGTF
jgi:hypothetical protein